MFDSIIILLSTGNVSFKKLIMLWLIADSLSMMDVSEEERLNIFDIDSDQSTNGFWEYAVDIFQHLREAEVSRIIRLWRFFLIA